MSGFVTSCGGGSSQQQSQSQNLPSVQGKYEVISHSSSGPVLVVETTLSQDASGNLKSNPVILGGAGWPFNPSSSDMWLGGNCIGFENGSSISGTINASGSVTWALSENSFMFNYTGSSSGSSISGNYQSPSGSACPDSGSFVATKLMSPLSGTFATVQTFPPPGFNSLTATLSEDSAHNITVTGTADGTPYTLTASLLAMGSL